MPGEILHTDISSNRAVTEVAVAMANDQTNVPVVSAIQPAIMGEIVPPIPKIKSP